MSTELVSTKLRQRAAVMREAGHNDDADLDEEAADELTALTAKVALLTEALAPFAREADARANLALGPDIDHWPIGGSALTLGDIRAARRAISEPDKEGT